MQHLWRKRYAMAGWITLSAVSLVLLISAVKARSSKVCKGINVEINGTGNNFFVDTKEVTKILTSTGEIKGEALTNINLRMLESRLKKDEWIASAQLFFDNQEMLQVVVEEKNPVARIFTVDGSSFYIDTACNHLPLSNKLSARVPMFTNFPTGNVKLSTPDSSLMASVKELALFIQADEFWKAQVAQVDITPESFIMVPTVGDHIVVLGNGADYKAKFDRLYSFYKQVWTKVGFEKYEKIDVQYDGQIVATKRGANIVKVDSAKAKDALNTLLLQTKKATEASTDTDSSDSKVTINDKVNSRLIAKQKMPDIIKQQKIKVKTAHQTSTTIEKPIDEVSKLPEDKKVPKAVMKKQEH